MAFPTIDANTPAGGDKKKFGDNEIRALKQAIIDCMTEICDFPTSNTLKGVGVVPVGGIIPYDGDVADLPTNWKVCDGTNGTPNLVDKFIRGSSSADKGKTGGADTHTHTATTTIGSHELTINEMPPHTHYVAGDSTSAPGGYNSISANNGQSAQKWFQTESTGSGGGHTHTAGTTLADGSTLPAYYTLVYIKRVS